jgi:hypothetical protein
MNKPHSKVMGHALRIDEIIGDFGPPPALRNPPPFVPRNLPAELVAELRRRAELARSYNEQVTQLSSLLLRVTDNLQVTEEAEPKHVALVEGMLVKVIQACVVAAHDVDEELRVHEPLRAMAELLEGPDRAAWMAFLEPMIQGLRTVKIATNIAAGRVSALAKQISGIDHDLWPGETEEERLLNSRAAFFYRVFAERELGVLCQEGWVIEGGVPFPVVKVSVPDGIDRPRHYFRAAIERVHEWVADTRPDLLGRITWDFVRSENAT